MKRGIRVKERFIATLVDVKDITRIPKEFVPLVEFKAKLEKREIKGNEKVAILNIVSTSSYLPIFLDPGKRIEDIEEEVKTSHAILNHETKNILRNILEGFKR